MTIGKNKDVLLGCKFALPSNWQYLLSLSLKIRFKNLSVILIPRKNLEQY